MIFKKLISIVVIIYYKKHKNLLKVEIPNNLNNYSRFE